MTAVNGTKNMLDLGKEKQSEGVVYISSMEAFGAPDPEKPYVKEDDLGYIDIHNPRSCYPEGKRLCECMCSSYASEYKLPVRIARLSQTFGAGISYEENRVFAQFAKAAMNKTDIVLHTAGKSVGNYCYTRDAVMGILLLLVKGNDGEAYTVAHPEAHITIGDMAKMVAEKLANNEIKVVFTSGAQHDIYELAFWEDEKHEIKAIEESKLLLSGKFLVNHTKKVYLDCDAYLQHQR